VDLPRANTPLAVRRTIAIALRENLTAQRLSPTAWPAWPPPPAYG